jgi:hypothetical protein
MSRQIKKHNMKKVVIIALTCFVVKAGAQNPFEVTPAGNNNRIGINTLPLPTNRVQITTSLGDPYFPAAPGGSSGLRFTNLTSGSIALPVATKVLSVDALGNVVLVNASTGIGTLNNANNGLSVFGGNTVQLGGACGSPSLLLNNREIGMAGHNINWTMPVNSPSEFLIGVPTCSTSICRFGVSNDHYQVAGLFQNVFNSATATQGIGSRATNNGGGNAIGVAGSAISTGNSIAIGVNGSSQGTTSANNIALNGNALNGTVFSIAGNLDCQNSASPLNIGHQTDINGGTNPGASNYGVQVLINNQGSSNFGGFFSVNGAANNYGVFATALPGVGGSGPTTGALGPNYAGFFNGDVFISGLYGISDKRLKKDITKMENSLDIIKKLSPVTYSFDQQNHPNLVLAKGKQYGFIAQDIKEVLPELTGPIVFPATIDENGKQTTQKEEYIGINYQGFTAIIVDAIKQQQSIIENQQKQIDELKAMVQAQSGLNTSVDGNRQAVTLSNQEVVVLNQNSPNPFAEQSVISYNIPPSAGVAQMLFYNLDGQLLKTVDITTKGKGVLTVFANDLTNGVYNYTLVIDGKIMDTKKMMKQQ